MRKKRMKFKERGGEGGGGGGGNFIYRWDRINKTISL
jgi:hypothetical protein